MLLFELFLAKALTIPLGFIIILLLFFSPIVNKFLILFHSLFYGPVYKTVHAFFTLHRDMKIQLLWV